MYFQAETNGVKYEITVHESRSAWKIGIKAEGKDWIHHEISKTDYQYMDNTISFLYKNSSYLVDVVHTGLECTVYTRGAFRQVTIYNEEKLVHESLKAGGSMGQRDHLSAGMPGKIVKVFVQPGEIVKKNDPLLIMEAMKMENEIRAPHDATVDQIHVKQGDNVEGGALLMTFSDDGG